MPIASGPAAAGDFFRSGPGAGGSVFPDGVGDTTDAIVHNGRLALGSLDPTLTTTQFQSTGGIAPGVQAPAGVGGAPGVGVGTLIGEQFNAITVAGLNFLLPAASTVPGRIHEFHNFQATPINLNASIAGNLFRPGDAAGSTTLVIPGLASFMAFSNGSGWLITFNQSAPSSGFLAIPTVTTPARTLNTDFTPHATRPVLGLYSVRISGQTTLLSGDEGRIELRANLGAPVTPRAQVGMRIAQALGVTIGTNSANEGELVFLFPPGWSGRLHTVTVLAAPSFSIVRQTEVIL